MNASTNTNKPWTLYLDRCAERGVSKRTALAMVERHELVSRLQAAGVVNIADDQSIADLREIERELQAAGHGAPTRPAIVSPERRQLAAALVEVDDEIRRRSRERARILDLLSALLVALCLVGCGGAEPDAASACAAPVPDLLLIAVLDSSAPPECSPAYNPTTLSSACELWGGDFAVDVPAVASGGPADGV